MKPILLRFFTVLVVFFALTVGLSAQSALIRTVANTTIPSTAVNTRSKAEPAGVFDVTAGQQEARFEQLEEYLAASIIYPDVARDFGTEGAVQVLLRIGANGQVTQAEVIESLGYGCDEHVLALVRTMPRWEPARNYGIAVASKKILRVEFNLR